MKIRLDRKMYAQAQLIAHAQRVPVSEWVFRADCRYGFTEQKPSHPLSKLTRANSVSVAVKVGKDSRATPQRIRECIALAIEAAATIPSEYRYRMESLEAVIRFEALAGRILSYYEAQAFIDRRIEERKEEIRVSNLNNNKN